MADISETSGGEHGSYFDGCLLNTMEILIKDIEKRSGEKLKEPYVVYMIETRWESDVSAFVRVCFVWIIRVIDVHIIPAWVLYYSPNS